MHEPGAPPPLEIGPAGPGRAAWWRPLLLLAVVIGLFMLARALGLGEKLGLMRGWIASLGNWGPVVFILIYAAATVAAVPGLALTLLAGGLFGSLKGSIVVSLGATLGAALAFLVARYFARQSVARWLAGNEKFARLDRLTERHGAIIVAITRLVPLFPFNLLNYGLGLTRVPFWSYLFWSWLCMLPATVIYVVGADAIFKGLAQGRVPWGLVAVAAAGAVALVFIIRQARRRLAVREAADGQPPDQDRA